MMIRPSDTVLHIPSGETWTVCGVDYERGELIPCGYPFPTLAKLDDCKLIKQHYTSCGQPADYVRALEREGLTRFVWAGKYTRYRIVEDPKGKEINSGLLQLLTPYCGDPRGPMGVPYTLERDPIARALELLESCRQFTIEGADEVFFCVPEASYRKCMAELREAMKKR